MTASAETLMKQAGWTAEYWLRSAKDFVEEEFKGLPPAQRTTLIAAYVQAAALDELAMNVRSISDGRPED